MTDETILVLGNLVFPVGAARGITQSLEPIDNGELRRTVNGVLVDTTRAANQKYRSALQCTDMDAPSLANVWRGKLLTVQCIAFLNQEVDPTDDTATLTRDAVEASIVGLKADGTKLAPDSYDDMTRVVTFTEDVISVRFRPILDMRVVDFSLDEDEYGAETQWSLDLEEV